MARNTRALVSTARIDNEKYREDIETAREFIFLGGYNVKSKAVENVLADRSLVPIKVFKFTVRSSGLN